MKRIILLFGGLGVGVLVLFELRRYSLLFGSRWEEWWLVVVAVLFLLVGWHLRPNPGKEGVVAENAVPPIPDQELLTKREQEVLIFIEKGYSNQEIARALFISETTVKSHVSNILSKLDARRRTQAVRIAKEQGIL